MNQLFYLIVVLTFLCAPLGFAQHAGEACDEAGLKSGHNGVLIPAHASDFKVAGEGKAYFYSAPLDLCKQKTVFLVPSDLVNAYVGYEAFTSVMYIHPVSGKITEGWIKAERLKSTGRGLGPDINTKDR